MLNCVAGLTCKNNELADNILSAEVDAGVGLAVAILLGKLHCAAEGNILAQGVEDEVEGTTEHSLNLQNLVAAVYKVVDGADDGESGTNVCLEKIFHVTHARNLLQAIIG